MTEAAGHQSGSIDAKASAPNSIAAAAPVAYHAVAPEELDSLRWIERPLSLIAAGLFAGAFVGTLFPAIGAFKFALTGAGEFTLRDLGFVVACAGSFGVAVTAAIVGLSGKSKVAKALDRIARRAPIELPPGHAAAPKA